MAADSMAADSMVADGRVAPDELHDLFDDEHKGNWALDYKMLYHQ